MWRQVYHPDDRRAVLNRDHTPAEHEYADPAWPGTYCSGCKPDPNACVGGVCRTIDELCSRHQSQYQRKWGRASNE